MLLARGTVVDKIRTQEDAARHYQRQGVAGIGPVRRRLRRLRHQCESAAQVEALRGLEGTASAAWFELYGRLLKQPWAFTKRERRPPRDPLNALLSLGYTWLLSRTVAKLSSKGLEVSLGALHEYRAGRPLLACDLMEPFRTGGVDRWVLNVCNQGEVQPGDFVTSEKGTRLQPEKFAQVLHYWETWWTKGGFDGSLDGAIDRWIAAVRRLAREQPDP